ncbi:MAG TPA: hypothetical protein DEP66_05475, partial [Acidimicrobiaceae bacterium]|nr:hypothetical protein [Acidimicrobiaceae bacterium]
MALRPYSVSPRRTLHRRGPNPRKNSVARMPVRRAAAKWPSSCMNRTNASTPTTTSAAGDPSHASSAARATTSAPPAQRAGVLWPLSGGGTAGGGTAGGGT